ncbi:type I-E CRISPR-associated protein Cas6/Cse3/CasE [Streptomyces sp. NPDC018036]|uniref:type I-E CRISPR-associated protein Cas6/Cse3/CasE n=1 Tax=Streptomyces sp. NPDC018036 TaxID=3365035 RepID=UPI0037A77705
MTPTATLTRIRLNTAHHAVRRDLADRVQLHKTLMRLTTGIPSPHPRRDAGLLFRLDTDHDQPTLLVQTTQPPNLAGLPDRYGTLVAARDLSPLLHALTPGRHVRYRITAVPVRHLPGSPCGRRPDGSLLRRRGTPTALHGHEAAQWWQRRASQSGLALTSISLTPRTFERSPHAPYRPGLDHRLIQFDGHARITDAHLLAQSICRGIGRAQSYGAGLLSLAPA